MKNTVDPDQLASSEDLALQFSIVGIEKNMRKVEKAIYEATEQKNGDFFFFFFFQ